MDLAAERMGCGPIFAVVGQDLAVGDDSEPPFGARLGAALRHVSRARGGGAQWSGTAGERRRGDEYGPVGSPPQGDKGNDQIVVWERRKDEVLRRSSFEMVIDVEDALSAIGDRPPAGIFGQLGRERAIGRIVQAGQAER